MVSNRFYYHPDPCKKWSNSTNLFFKRVAQPPTGENQDMILTKNMSHKRKNAIKRTTTWIPFRLQNFFQFLLLACFFLSPQRPLESPRYFRPRSFSSFFLFAWRSRWMTSIWKNVSGWTHWRKEGFREEHRQVVGAAAAMPVVRKELYNLEISINGWKSMGFTEFISALWSYQITPHESRLDIRPVNRWSKPTYYHSD